MPEKKNNENSITVMVVFLIMTLLFLSTLAGFAWVVSDVRQLSKENKNRIEDIQRSRLESCKTTYEGIREVFKPFFPKEPRTQKQQDALDLFNKKIIELQLKCVRQVSPLAQVNPKGGTT